MPDARIGRAPLRKRRNEVLKDLNAEMESQMPSGFRQFLLEHATSGETIFTLKGLDGHHYRFFVDGLFPEEPTDECVGAVIKAWAAADPQGKCKITRIANPRKKMRAATVSIVRKYFITHDGQLRPIDKALRRVIV